jgi:hypothetical protein
MGGDHPALGSLFPFKPLWSRQKPVDLCNQVREPPELLDRDVERALLHCFTASAPWPFISPPRWSRHPVVIGSSSSEHCKGLLHVLAAIDRNVGSSDEGGFFGA